jgi:SWIM zinc finger
MEAISSIVDLDDIIIRAIQSFKMRNDRERLKAQKAADDDKLLRSRANGSTSYGGALVPTKLFSTGAAGESLSNVQRWKKESTALIDFIDQCLCGHPLLDKAIEIIDDGRVFLLVSATSGRRAFAVQSTTGLAYHHHQLMKAKKAASSSSSMMSYAGGPATADFPGVILAIGHKRKASEALRSNEAPAPPPAPPASFSDPKYKHHWQPEVSGITVFPPLAPSYSSSSSSSSASSKICDLSELGGCYAVFPSSLYCSCAEMTFTVAVTRSGTKKLCKHLLAVLLADAFEGTSPEEEISSGLDASLSGFAPGAGAGGYYSKGTYYHRELVRDSDLVLLLEGPDLTVPSSSSASSSTSSSGAFQAQSVPISTAYGGAAAGVSAPGGR